MKTFLTVCLCILFALDVAAVAQNLGDQIKFKGKIGFINDEDEIVEHKFLDGGKRLLIIGERTVQIWDVEKRQLLNSVQQHIPEFASGSFISTYMVSGFPKFIDWRSYLVDENGRWIITSEKIGANKFRSAVVRDLQSLKQIAVLEMPDVSAEYISYYEPKNQIMTFGVTNKTAILARWSADDFSSKELLKIDDYKWHQSIRDDSKLVVGSGDVNVFWSGFYDKQGDLLTLRNPKSGEIEKTYTAENLKPKSSFKSTTVSADEKYLISTRDNRVFVWEIDGDGKPKFEISNPDPKGDFDFKRIIDQRFIHVKFGTQIRIYDVEGNGSPMFSLAPQNEKEDISFEGFIGNRFVVIKAGDKFRVYDAASGVQSFKYELASDDPKDTMKFYGAVDNGKYIIARDDDKILILETAGDGRVLYQIVRNSEKERFPTIAYVEDKNLLVVARVNNSEKKPPVTEFYDLKTGKLIFNADFEAAGDVKFTPDDTRLYQKNIGSFKVWNLLSKKLKTIDLQTREERIYDPGSMDYTTTSTYNAEYADFNDDYQYILRHGEARLTVFDAQNGAQFHLTNNDGKPQPLKKGKSKQDRFGKAGWILDGRYVYAINETGFFVSTKTISLWEIKN